MLAHPEAGQTYREEYYKGHAEDRSRVLALDQQAEVPFGHFTDVLLTEDYTPIEPDVLELKFYAKGIGQVLAQTVSGGSEREELVSYTKSAPLAFGSEEPAKKKNQTSKASTHATTETTTTRSTGLIPNFCRMSSSRSSRMLAARARCGEPRGDAR